MTSTTSSANQKHSAANNPFTLYLWSLKQIRGVAILYLAILLIAIPIILLLVLGSVRDTKNYTENLFSAYHEYMGVIFTFAIQPLAILLSLIFTILLFGYMQKKRSVDLFHALPISRTRLFLSRYFAGLSALLAPLCLVSLIAEIVRLAYNIDSVSTSRIMLRLNPTYLPSCMLLIAAAYTFSVFLTVCSGTTFDAVMSILVISFTYPLMTFMGRVCAGLTIPGMMPFRDDGISLGDMLLSPYFGALLATTTFKGDFAYHIWWGFFTIAVFAGALLLYRRRASECAESHFAFPIPKITVRFIATFAAALCCGLLFLLLIGNKSGYFFMGAFLGSICTHLIAEGIYSRGFKQLGKSFLFYGGFVVVFAAMFASFSFGFFGYDTRIPALSEIESANVEISGYRYGFTVNSYSSKQGVPSEALAEVSPRVDDPQKAIDLHQELISLNRLEKYPYIIDHSTSKDITITYQLKNGQTISRYYSSYNFPEGTDYSGLMEKLNAILALPEYYQDSQAIFYFDADAIDSIDVNGENGLTGTHTLTSEQQEALLAALQEDTRDSIPQFDANYGYLYTGSQQELVDTNVETASAYSIYLNISPFVPKNEKLKALVGDYQGRVEISCSNYYNLAPYPKTFALLKDWGWVGQS